MGKKGKNRVVYSTNPDYSYEEEGQQEETLPPEEQELTVRIDTKGRKGKVVTLIDGFVGTSDDLKVLEKSLKTKCGVGGSSKDGQVILQGSAIDKAIDLLNDLGYRSRRK